jgi:two-component system, OmpR family, response regulator PhoP
MSKIDTIPRLELALMTDHHPPPAYSQTPVPHVFVLEDNAELRQDILLPGLRAQGFRAHGAGTATEFYRLMLTQRFDLIVLDLGLPDADGLTVAHHLRTNSDMGIVILSGCEDRQYQLKALKNGADFYLAKPVDLDVLSTTLHNLFRRMSSRQDIRDAESQPAQTGRWLLANGGWRLVSPGGKNITLTAPEQCALAMLASEGGAPVSRDDLIRALTRNVYDFDPHRLEMMIHRLRRKAHVQTGETLPLMTVRGSGYLFNGDSDSSIATSS